MWSVSCEGKKENISIKDGTCVSVFYSKCFLFLALSKDTYATTISRLIRQIYSLEPLPAPALSSFQLPPGIRFCHARTLAISAMQKFAFFWSQSAFTYSLSPFVFLLLLGSFSEGWGAFSPLSHSFLLFLFFSFLRFLFYQSL